MDHKNDVKAEMEAAEALLGGVGGFFSRYAEDAVREQEAKYALEVGVYDPLVFLDVGGYLAVRLSGRVPAHFCSIPQKGENLVELAKEMVASRVFAAAKNLYDVQAGGGPADLLDQAIVTFRDRLEAAERDRVAAQPRVRVTSAPIVIKRMMGPVAPTVLLGASQMLIRVKASKQGGGATSFVLPLSEVESVKSESVPFGAFDGVASAPREAAEIHKLDSLQSFAEEAVFARVALLRSGAVLLDRPVSLGDKAPLEAIQVLVTALRQLRGTLERAAVARFFEDEKEAAEYDSAVPLPEKEDLT